MHRRLIRRYIPVVLRRWCSSEHASIHPDRSHPRIDDLPAIGRKKPAVPMLKETAPQVSARVIKCGTDLLLNNRRTYADIRALDRALVLEDLPAARAAFNRLQEDSPFIAEALSRDPFPVKTRPLRALKPFTMLAIATLFLGVLFKGFLPGSEIVKGGAEVELYRSYISGAILLGIAPCTAMVLVWGCLRIAPFLFKVFGAGGLNAIARIMGFIVIAIGVNNNLQDFSKCPAT